MTGIYDPSGAYKMTAVDGQTFVGIYAPDGSYNVVIQNADSPAVQIDTETLLIDGAAPNFEMHVTGDAESNLQINPDANGDIQIAMGSGSTAPDTFLKRLAANTLGMINGTTAQIFLLYNTFTSASVYERAFFRWVSNVLEIGNEMVGGTLRSIRLIGQSVIIRTAGTDRVNFGSAQVICSTDNGYAIGGASNRFSRLVLAPTALASLPTAATAGAGAIAIASDLNSTTFNATAASGGSNVMLVHSDGTNWKIG